MHDTCRVFNYCNCHSWVRYSTGMSTEAIVTLKVGLDCFFLSLTVITRGDSWSVGSNFSLLNASLEKKFLPNHVQSCKLFRKCSQFLPLGNPTSHPLFFHPLQFSVPVPLRTPPPQPHFILPKRVWVCCQSTPFFHAMPFLLPYPSEPLYPPRFCWKTVIRL